MSVQKQTLSNTCREPHNHNAALLCILERLFYTIKTNKGIEEKPLENTGVMFQKYDGDVMR